MNFRNLAVFVLAVLASISFASALQSVSPQSFSVNQSLSSLYNITIGNSDSGSVNISQINITLPAGFSFTSSSNGTSVQASSVSFSQSGQVLSWSNVTNGLIINGTNQSFWFYASANSTSIGTFYMNISILNSTGLSYSTINVSVNDTLPPTLSFVGSSPSPGANLSQNFIPLNISASDNYNVSSITLYVYNSTFSLMNSTSVSASMAFLNATNLKDGLYYMNATSTDSFGNTNSSLTRSVTLDTSSPVVTLTIHTADVTSTQVAMDVSVSDSGTGLSSCSINSTTASPTSWTATSQEVKETAINSNVNIVCGNTVIRNVTCTDYAGNQGSAVLTMGSTGCPVTGSTTGSTGSGATQTWSGTYYQNNAELSSLGTINQSLGELQRVGVQVANTLHYVGVLNVYGSSADIQVQSDPQNATLSVGETKKFELTGDNYYDLAVTLVSIQNNQANLSLSEIHELIPGTQTNQSSSSSSISQASSNSSSQNSSSISSESKNSLSPKNLTFWAVGVLIVLALAAGIWIFIRRKKSK